MNEVNLIDKARIFATAAHAAVGQVRKYTGEAACQRLMDEEIAEYYKEQNEWVAGVTSDLVLLDYELASKRIKQYGSR